MEDQRYCNNYYVAAFLSVMGKVFPSILFNHICDQLVSPSILSRLILHKKIEYWLEYQHDKQALTSMNLWIDDSSVSFFVDVGFLHGFPCLFWLLILIPIRVLSRVGEIYFSFPNWVQCKTGIVLVPVLLNINIGGDSGEDWLQNIIWGPMVNVILDSI